MAAEEIAGVEITLEQIKEKIHLITTYAGEKDGLKLAMDNLKIALHANPEACSLLLPEEIGACVTAIRKIKGVEVTAASGKEVMKRSKKIDLTNVDILKSAMEDF